MFGQSIGTPVDLATACGRASIIVRSAEAPRPSVPIAAYKCDRMQQVILVLRVTQIIEPGSHPTFTLPLVALDWSERFLIFRYPEGWKTWEERS